jgi:hypothetical protein
MISPICHEPSSLQVQCMWVQWCSSNSQSKQLCAWNYPKFQFHVSIKTQAQGKQSLKVGWFIVEECKQLDNSCYSKLVFNRWP